MATEETGVVARRVGLLLLALAGAVVLFLGLVGGGVVLFLYWHDRNEHSLQHRQDAIVGHYAREYDECVQQQRGTRAWCSERSYRRCAADTFWVTEYGDLGAVSAITEYCDDADG